MTTADGRAGRPRMAPGAMLTYPLLVVVVLSPRRRTDYLSEGLSASSSSHHAAGPSSPSSSSSSRPSSSSSAPGPASSSALAIAHSTPLLTVSPREAARLHSSHTSELHSTRRLALIVDLDQTVVHATVDPTVGDWLADLDLDDDAPSSSDDTRPASGQQRPHQRRRLKRPSTRANLASVGRFTLDEHLSSPSGGGGSGCWYYLKPRPGLAGFLDRMAAKYEMHVYTMGTRAYADRVCGLIDPDGRFFGRRILSRDESGSEFWPPLPPLIGPRTRMHAHGGGGVSLEDI